jgi:hypothetical protein
MQSKSHRALRILMLLFAIVEALVGVLFLFGPGRFLSFLPAGLTVASPEFTFALLKLLGALALALGYLSYAASRDPVRYVAVIDAFAFLLIAAAAIDIFSLMGHVPGTLFAARVVIPREAVRLLLAAWLIWLRPRAATADQVT